LIIIYDIVTPQSTIEYTTIASVFQYTVVLLT